MLESRANACGEEGWRSGLPPRRLRAHAGAEWGLRANTHVFGADEEFAEGRLTKGRENAPASEDGAGGRRGRWRPPRRDLLGSRCAAHTELVVGDAKTWKRSTPANLRHSSRGHEPRDDGYCASATPISGSGRATLAGEIGRAFEKLGATRRGKPKISQRRAQVLKLSDMRRAHRVMSPAPECASVYHIRERWCARAASRVRRPDEAAGFQGLRTPRRRSGN